MTRFPAGSRKIIDRFPQGWVAGGMTHSTPSAVIRPVLGVDVVDEEIEDDLVPALAAGARRIPAVVVAVFGEPPPGEADGGRPGLDLEVVIVQRHRHAQQAGVEPGQPRDLVGDDPALHQFHRYPRSPAAAAPEGRSTGVCA